jgi:serine/threonine protein kinase
MQKSDSKIPVKWYAPEAISIGKFTTKSDVWSFGITLWEMFSYGATPYGLYYTNLKFSKNFLYVLGDMSGTDVYYYLQHGKRLERPSRCPSSIYQLMLKCWEWDEKKRPTFSQLLQSLKTDPENKAIPITTTLLRTKSLKTTLSSSTLTDENNRDNDDNNNNNSEKTDEQYKSNGNGHVSKAIMHFQQTLNKERTNS